MDCDDDDNSFKKNDTFLILNRITTMIAVPVKKWIVSYFSHWLRPWSQSLQKKKWHVSYSSIGLRPWSQSLRKITCFSFFIWITTMIVVLFKKWNISHSSIGLRPWSQSLQKMTYFSFFNRVAIAKNDMFSFFTWTATKIAVLSKNEMFLILQ